jgi:signal transduction histidine kinase/AraC-like DNA-binding protein/streptogramin lyase
MAASANSDKLYIAYEKDDIKIFDIKSGTYKDLDLQSKNDITFIVNTFFEKSEDELWIGTDSGLIIYNLKRGNSVCWDINAAYSSILSRRFITDIYKDREGGIWICTRREGVNYISPPTPFGIYYPKKGENGIKGSVIRNICSDKYDNIWIGTEDAGLNCLEKATGKFTNYQPSSNGNSIKHSNIRGLAASGDKLYIGHLIHGIDVMDIPSRKIIRNYPLLRDENKTTNSTVNLIKVLDNGSVYVSTDEGMYSYEPSDDKFVYCEQFPETAIRSVYEDRSGKIWAGVSNSCFLFDPKTNSGTSFIYDTNSAQNNNFINDMYEDINEDMWIASNEGLIKYSLRTGKSTYFTTENGMPSNKAFKILKDDAGKLWISTPAGLACLEPKSNRIVTYNKSHGLPTRQFNKGAAYAGKDGKFYFGTVKGVVYFDPKEISQYDSTENVTIGIVQIDDEKNTKYVINSGGKDPVKGITLRQAQSTFEISFSTMDYIAPTSTKFLYRLGKDEKWAQTDGRNKVKFTHMAPGSYIFEVRSSQSDNMSESPSTKLHITILPPLWQRWEAYCLYFLLFLGLGLLIASLWRKRIQKNQKQKDEQFEDKKNDELRQAKLSFFINIAHEIRTPLTLIKGPLERLMASSEISNKDSQSLNIMHKNVEQLLSLVNQLLRVKDDKIAAYKPFFTNVDIHELIQNTIIRYKDSDTSKTIKVTSELEGEKLYVAADKEMLVKIMNNLMSNAFKYGDKRIWIHVSMDENGENVMVTIMNDGKFIEYNKYKEKVFEPFYRKEDSADKVVGSGLGLPLARSLAELNNGTLELVENDKYTSFRLTLPLRQKMKTLDDEMAFHSDDDLSKESPLVYERDRTTILIVEDNADLNRFIAEEMSETYNVMVAHNGKEAIDLLEREDIQLIISDIMMPEMDGIELLKRVKTTKEWCSIPVILLTAKSHIETQIEGLELGADIYMEKPFSNVLLKTQVTNLIYNRNIIRKFYFDSPIANMKPIVRNKNEEEFMERFNNIVEENIGNPDLDIEMLSDKMNMSKANLFRKVKSASEISPNEIIKITRLKKAAELLIKGEMKIYEISESLGFRSQSYFTLAFVKQFGVTPSKYAKENK